MPSLFALTFQNGLQYRLLNACVNSHTNASTQCKSLMKIDTLVFELQCVERENCVAAQPKFNDHHLFGTLTF